MQLAKISADNFKLNCFSRWQTCLRLTTMTTRDFKLQVCWRLRTPISASLLLRLPNLNSLDSCLDSYDHHPTTRLWLRLAHGVSHFLQGFNCSSCSVWYLPVSSRFFSLWENFSRQYPWTWNFAPVYCALYMRIVQRGGYEDIQRCVFTGQPLPSRWFGRYYRTQGVSMTWNCSVLLCSARKIIHTYII